MPKRPFAARAAFLGSSLLFITVVAARVAATSSGQATGPSMTTPPASPGMTGGMVIDPAKAEQMVVVTTIPSGYRDWKFVSAAHEADDLNDIRVVIANERAIRAYRAGKPFPEGSVIGRVAWKLVPS